MLENVLESCQFVVDHAEHVKINYEKANALIEELLGFQNEHYLLNVSNPVYKMKIDDLVNFLLVFDAIDFSFWGDPKWSIEVGENYLDGGTALLHCIYGLFQGGDSKKAYAKIEKMTLEDFKVLLKGNVEIPLLEERVAIIKNIISIVNNQMNGSFYDHIKDLRTDEEIFQVVLDAFPNFKDIRVYQGKTVYFYKLAQLLTSDILHVMRNKEHVSVDYSHLIGCADYKIPQVMEGFGILVYDAELSSLIESKTPIEENSAYEVEIRASMLVVINAIYYQINQAIDRIDINDFIWGKGQDKTKQYQPYHLTRTTTY